MKLRCKPEGDLNNSQLKTKDSTSCRPGVWAYLDSRHADRPGGPIVNRRGQLSGVVNGRHSRNGVLAKHKAQAAHGSVERRPMQVQALCIGGQINGAGCPTWSIRLVVTQRKLFCCFDTALRLPVIAASIYVCSAVMHVLSRPEMPSGVNRYIFARNAASVVRTEHDYTGISVLPRSAGRQSMNHSNGS